MHKSIIIFYVLFLYLTGEAKSFSYVPCQLYVKIYNYSKIEIPIFEKRISYNHESYSHWNELIEQYHINSISKPFKLNDNDIQHIYLVTFEDSNNLNFIIQKLYTFPEVEYAHPKPIFHLSAVPNDIDTSQQWVFDIIQMNNNIWNFIGNKHIKVAIIDDAVKIDHPDLNIYTNINEIDSNQIDDDSNGYIDDIHGFDVASNDNNPNPPSILIQYYSHGTHCAGIAGAKTNNGVGIASVSNNQVDIIPVKCTNLPGILTNIEEGLDYAIASDPDIISMSWGGKDTSAYKTLYKLIEKAHQRGIILVAACGNNSEDSVNYPAGYNEVLAVGNTQKNDIVSPSSNYGVYIDIMAPGNQIFSTQAYSPYYGFLSGTSMSCPLVAGALALLKSNFSSLSNNQLIQCIKSGATPIDALNDMRYQNKLGAGRLNIEGAFNCAQITSLYHNESGYNESWVYPNPASDKLYILGNGHYNIEINDIHGKLITTYLNQQNNYLDIHHLIPGIYIITKIQSGNYYREKFVKLN